MAYLIDSDWVIDHLANVPEATQLFDELSEMGRLAISVVTYMEVYEGILRSPDPARAEEQFQMFVSAVPVLPFSPAIAVRCALLRHELRQTGKRVNSRALDLVIAATALEHDLTLVTRNTNDYKDIPDLTLHQSA